MALAELLLKNPPPHSKFEYFKIKPRTTRNLVAKICMKTTHNLQLREADKFRIVRFYDLDFEPQP